MLFTLHLEFAVSVHRDNKFATQVSSSNVFRQIVVWGALLLCIITHRVQIHEMKMFQRNPALQNLIRSPQVISGKGELAL